MTNHIKVLTEIADWLDGNLVTAPAFAGPKVRDAIAELDRLRFALEQILDIETRLGFPAGIDMQGIARRALKETP